MFQWPVGPVAVDGRKARKDYDYGDDNAGFVDVGADGEARH